MILDKLVKEKNWLDLITQFSPLQVAESLPFLINIQLAYNLLYNDKWDDNIQEFAIELLEVTRLEYSKEWNSSWQYDGFLGLAFLLTRVYNTNLEDHCLYHFRYDESYKALRRALEKADSPPPQLLIAMTNCCGHINNSPISYDQGIECLKIALKDYLYIDGVKAMRKLFWLKNDSYHEKEWADVFNKVRYHNKYAPSLDPEFIQEKLLSTQDHQWTLEKIIQKNNWYYLATHFNPLTLVKAYPFLENIQLGYDLLYNHKWDDDVQDFAVELLETTSNFYSEEWNRSWQYAGFLGLAYDLTRRYDERYEVLKRALDKTKNPPPQLLIAMANCCSCPGKPPVSYDEAIEYLKAAIKDYLYVDAVQDMRWIYRSKGDLQNEKYWANIFDEIKDHNKSTPSLDPEFIIEKFSNTLN